MGIHLPKIKHLKFEKHQQLKLTSASLYPSELEPMGILKPLTSLPSAHAFFHTPSPASVEVELKRVDEMAQ